MAQDLLPTRQTKADFLAFIATEPQGRFEFDGERIVDMTGGTFKHDVLTDRISDELKARLDRKVWAVLVHNRGVETVRTVRYPDVVVLALQAGLSDPNALVTQTPILAIEVTSPSSKSTDHTRKPAEYGEVPTIQAVLVFQHDARACSVWQRCADGSFDSAPKLVTKGSVSLRWQKLRLPLADIYDGLVD